MESETIQLSSGLRLVHVRVPAARSVTVTLFLGVGSRYEPEREAGVSHLIEHMLFKGTERRPTSRAISATLDSVGGVLNASTDKELTVFWAKAASEHTPLAIDLLGDMVRNSLLRSRDLTREKGIIVEELGMLLDDPQDWVHVLLDDLLWPGQPLGREVAGTAATVSALRRSTVLHFFDRFYGPNNAVLSVTGRLERDEAMALAEHHFAGWTVATPVPAAPALESDGVSPVALDARSNEQVNLCLGYPGVSRRHPDRWALDVLSLILGGGTSSRLFLSVRENLGLAYDVHAYVTHFSDTGSLVLYAGTQPEKTERLLEQVERELDRMRRRRVTEAELERAKRYYSGRLWLDLEDTYAVSSWFGAQEILHHEKVTPEQVVSAVNSVTREDVLRVARTYLRPEGARLAAIGPVNRSVLGDRAVR